MPDISLSAVRSSLVMSMVGYAGWIDAVEQLVPSKVFMQICKKYCIKKANAMEVEGDLSVYDYQPYHNWKHIAYCMTELMKHGYDNTDVMRGILLHDAIDPHNIDELNNFSFRDVNAATSAIVSAVVSATDHGHLDAAKLTLCQKIVHDVDMSILATRAGVYEQYVRLIKKEYIDIKGVSIHTFNLGRADFIRKLLRQDRIFFTSHYREDRARENLRRELASLT